MEKQTSDALVKKNKGSTGFNGSTTSFILYLHFAVIEDNGAVCLYNY